jgi:hypothetical protein
MLRARISASGHNPGHQCRRLPAVKEQVGDIPLGAAGRITDFSRTALLEVCELARELIVMK